MEFDKEFHDIDGQFKLQFNQYEYGVCEEKIELQDEMLFCWFSLLNKSNNILVKDNYVAMKIPDLIDSYFVFVKENKSIKVSWVLAKDYGKDLYIKKEPLKKVYKCYWENIIIDYEEFSLEISKKTKAFISELIMLNNKILISNNFRNFIEACSIKKEENFGIGI